MMNVKTWSLVGLQLCALWTGSALASEPGRWMVSTTGTVPSSPETDHLMDPDDASLFQVTAGVSSHAYATRGNWFAMAGFVPGDIDGVAFRSTGSLAGHRTGLLFSLLSNEAGFDDGDVLGLALGGAVERVIAEADIAMAMGVPDAALDLDGFDLDAEGRLVFSLQADVAGTMLGDVSRGDVLRMEGPGAISRLFTLDEVQFALDMAAANAGLSSGALGDVHGVAVDGEDVYVVVQSPSALDGAVVRLGLVPAIVADEAAMGLGGAELDALAIVPDAFDVGAIALDQHTTIPGTMVHGEGHGFAPGAPVALMMVGHPGGGYDTGLPGFGDLLVDPNDGFWTAAFPMGYPIEMADNMGSFQVNFGLPAGSQGAAWAGTSGWSFQALDLSTLALTAPFRVQVF